MTRFALGALLFLSASVLTVGVPRCAHAETNVTCTGFIGSLPAVIGTSGTWCVKQDLREIVGSSNAITVNANNVTIDCNDFLIDGIASGGGATAHGIVAANRLNVTVRNCNIRGFVSGVFFTGSSGGGHVVEANHFDSNTWVGIWVEGDGSVVRGNQVIHTGMSTALNNPVGINTAYSVSVIDNTVSGVLSRTGTNSYATGIQTNHNSGGSITGNRVRGLLKSGSGFMRGIVNTNDTRVTMRANDLVGGSGAGSKGIACSSATSGVIGNLISGFAGGILTCSDAGGNYVLP